MLQIVVAVLLISLWTAVVLAVSLCIIRARMIQDESHVLQKFFAKNPQLVQQFSSLSPFTLSQQTEYTLPPSKKQTKQTLQKKQQQPYYQEDAYTTMMEEEDYQKMEEGEYTEDFDQSIEYDFSEPHYFPPPRTRQVPIPKTQKHDIVVRGMTNLENNRLSNSSNQPKNMKQTITPLRQPPIQKKPIIIQHPSSAPLLKHSLNK